MSAPLPPDRWQRVTDLFHGALGLDESDRAGWLEAECGGDADLRLEVESLLAADAAPDDEVNVGRAVDHAIGETAAAAIGPEQRIDRYRILQEIGHGGMATVFLAVRADAEFEQRVAIKVVRGALGADSLRRFRAERQILASLEHPCIARLIDGGSTEDGVPYFVMEYVEGLPIDEYCERNHVTVAQRLALFCRVCDAVNHAHQSFVVHRDIKPSNIIVADDGTPKLLDFGIAKLIDEGLVGEAPATMTAFRAMTPDYASPEQVRGGAITTASDVYSLGVLLYQLLTGQQPLVFRTRQAAEIVLVVCTAEPRKPSTVVAAGKLSRELAGDLDTIVLAALSKEPNRRYPTASAFAQDIRRHLAGMPVVARPATWRYRTTRFVARHRAGVAMAGVLATVVIGFGVALAEQMRTVSHERDTAQQVTGLLLEMYASLDPSGSAGGQLTAQELLDRGASRIQTEFRGQPETQVTLLGAIGSLYAAIGQPGRAAAILQESLTIRRALGPDTPETAATLTNLADAILNEGRFVAAEAAAREALDISRRLSGPRAPATATALNTLGLILILRGKTVEGAAVSGDAVDIWYATKGADSLEFADGLRTLIRAWRERGDYPKAERFDRGDLLRVERLERERLAARRRAFGDIHLLTADAQSSLGRLLHVMGRHVEAEPFFRDAIVARARIMGEKHLSVAEAMHNLAQVLQDQRRFVEAESLYKSSLEYLDLAIPAHAQRSLNLGNLASLLVDSGRFDEAETTYRSVIEQRQGLAGQERVALARTMRSLARLLLNRRRPSEAKPLADEALAICRTALGDAHPETQLSAQLQREVQAALSH